MSPQQVQLHDYTVEPSRDYGQISAIVRHKKIYRHLADDFSPHPNDYRCPEHPAVVYLLARDKGELLGVWMLIAINTVHWEIHWSPLPNAWGERARAATKEVFRWVWANTPCQRLTTAIPESNRLALVFARAVGMQVYGLNPNSFQKGGRLYAQALHGLSRPNKENA